MNYEKSLKYVPTNNIDLKVRVQDGALLEHQKQHSHQGGTLLRVNVVHKSIGMPTDYMGRCISL